MPIALLTTYLAPYRVPLFERLADRHEVEVLCVGGGERYVPPWFADLDRQLAAAPFPARMLTGLREAAAIGRGYEAVIGGFAGGAVLPAAYAGARRYRRPFVLWASVWSHPRSVSHALARPAIRQIYRDADAVVTYGEHVRRFVATIRGQDSDVFVARQAVEAGLFGRPVSAAEIESFRARHRIPAGPVVLYVGRLVREKGVDVLLDAIATHPTRRATTVLVGDGPLAKRAAAGAHVRLIGPLPRSELPVAYATADFSVLPSVPTPRFREPWGLVCNEAMHQGRPVIATTAVGAAAGGLVRDGDTGLIVPPADPAALSEAIRRLLNDAELRTTLGTAARAAVAEYNYDAMASGFDQALAVALGRPRPAS